MANLDMNLAYFNSDANQVCREATHSTYGRPFDVKEKKHKGDLGRQQHQRLKHPQANKRNNTFFHFNRSLHKWLGISASIIFLSLAVTGMLLNHKKSMGYMPDIEHKASGQISQGLPIEKVAMIAIKASDNKDITAIKDIDRIDYRTKNMSAKVRFKDAENTEVIVDSVTGEVLNVGSRTDVFLEKLHSGELFGEMFILITDFAAVSLILLIFTGIYIWIWRNWRRRSNVQLIKERNAHLNSQPVQILT